MFGTRIELSGKDQGGEGGGGGGLADFQLGDDRNTSSSRQGPLGLKAYFEARRIKSWMHFLNLSKDSSILGSDRVVNLEVTFMVPLAPKKNVLKQIDHESTKKNYCI